MGGAVSSGRDNNELIDNLVGGNYIRTASVERVFRSLDRADYMTRLSRDQAYKDLAWRDGALHLSAPCIYSEVMEGLELKPGVSFLNIGSGTGYLSTLVGLVIGASGISHGVEIVPSVVEYANKRLGQFMGNSSTLDELDFCEPRFYCGNGLSLAPLTVGYDRVYCGAGCPEEYQNYFKQLIKVGGILIMPLNDNLLQIRRTQVAEWTSRSLLSVSFATLRVPPADDRTDLLRLDELTPPRLMVLSRSVIRTAMRETLRRKHPELREPPPSAPPAKRQCPRRICIPVDENETDDLAAGLDALHDLDRDAGGAEMNALLSLVLNMGTNRAAGSLRVLDSDADGDDDDEDDDELSPRRSYRSEDESSSDSESDGDGGAGEREARAQPHPQPRPHPRRPWIQRVRDRDVIVFSIQNNLQPEREQDDRQPPRSHSPSPASSPPRFGLDESTYPPEYPAEFKSDDDVSCVCDNPACDNYSSDIKQEATSSQTNTMPTDNTSPTPGTDPKSSTNSTNCDSSLDEQPGSSKSVSKSKSKSSSDTRSKSSKRTTGSSKRKPVSRSDKNKPKAERIVISSITKPGTGSDTGTQSGGEGAKCPDRKRPDSPMPDIYFDMGPRAGSSAMPWDTDLDMDMEDDNTSECETVSPPTASRRKTDSGVGDEEHSPATSSPPTTATSSSYTAMSSDELTRDRRRRVKRRRNVASRSSSAGGSSTGAGGAADTAPRPRPPRTTPGAIRVRLSTLMKRGVKELPLPHELKRYVNFYRIFQF